MSPLRVFIRLLVCYILALGLTLTFIWYAKNAAASFLLLFFVIGFIPALLAVILLFLPIEYYLAKIDMNIFQLPALLLAGFALPDITLVALALGWHQWPDLDFEKTYLLNMFGIGWAMLWWLSGLFPKPRH